MNKAVAIAVLVLAVLAAGFATSQQNAFIGPRVVAKVSLANQTGNISPTTILTPPTDGIFRVSVYETMITQGAGFAVQLYWEDEAAGETAVVGSTVRGSTPPFAYCVSPAGTPTCGATFFAKGGTPIVFTTSADSNGGSYNLYIVVERLD